jgi:hypothetical protein
MAYRNKTFVSFASEDLSSYRLMTAWKANKNIEFNFIDAHDLNTALDTSQPETIRRRLRERVTNTKQVVLLLGSEDDAALVFVNPEKVSEYPPNPARESPDPGPYGGGAGEGPRFPDLAPVPTHEPDWTELGTYMTLRVSSFPAAGWDTRPQSEQQEDVGRWKVGGAPLDRAEGADPEEPPAFEADQNASGVLATAHIRKANPRGPGDQLRRIFRRGYPLIASGKGDLQRGLIFICFGRTITTQFEFITRGWMRNPDFPRPGAGKDRLLDQEALKEEILGGGYYFVPALEKKTQPWTWKLPTA